MHLSTYQFYVRRHEQVTFLCLSKTVYSHVRKIFLRQNLCKNYFMSARYAAERVLFAVN